MASPIELTLRAKTDVKPLDLETAQRIGRVAHAETIAVESGVAAFGFVVSVGGTDVARGNLELAARFELGAHWHTRYELGIS